MDRAQYIELRRIEAIDLAEAILNGTIDPIVGFQKLVNIRHDFAPNIDFDSFVVFESDTDTFPRGNIRNRYNKMYLEQLDREADAYLSASAEAIKGACYNLIKALS